MQNITIQMKQCCINCIINKCIHDECKKYGVRYNLTKPVKSQELFHYLKNINYQTDQHGMKEKSQKIQASVILTTTEISPVILIAEDVVLNMLLITTIVKQMVPNAKVLEAKNGKEVLRHLISETPSLIFMDIQMPEMDGIEATLAIRQQEQSHDSHIPIIALTAGSVIGEEEKCRKAGMDGFLTKPIVQNDVFKVLESYLAIPKEDTNEENKKIENETKMHFDEDLMIDRVGYDRDLWKDLFASVLTVFPEYIELLDKAILRRSRYEIKSTAHAMKEASSNMCFRRLVELADQMEDDSDFSAEKHQTLFTAILVEWKLIRSLLLERVF